MDIKKINFKQPKYMIPAIIYIPLLFTGYFLIDTFNVETSGPGNSKLKTTDYLSSELPEAYTDSVLGDKMDNTQREYGKISDLSGVQNVENDNDSVNKKQDYAILIIIIIYILIRWMEKLPHILRMIWNKNMYIKIYIHFLQKRSLLYFQDMLNGKKSIQIMK